MDLYGAGCTFLPAVAPSILVVMSTLQEGKARWAATMGCTILFGYDLHLPDMYFMRTGEEGAMNLKVEILVSSIIIFYQTIPTACPSSFQI